MTLIPFVLTIFFWKSSRLGKVAGEEDLTSELAKATFTSGCMIRHSNMHCIIRNSLTGYSGKYGVEITSNLMYI